MAGVDNGYDVAEMSEPAAWVQSWQRRSSATTRSRTRARLASAQARVLAQVDQAHAVIDSVDALPDQLMAEERLRGEAHLVELGRSHDAKQLRRLGKHLHGRFTVSSLHGAMLRKLLESFANPQLSDAVPRIAEGASPDEESQGGRRRLTCEVMGDALVRLIESYPVDKVPTSGGLNASVVVTMPLETLQDGLKRATVTGTGLDVSAATALDRCPSRSKARGGGAVRHAGPTPARPPGPNLRHVWSVRPRRPSVACHGTRSRSARRSRTPTSRVRRVG